MTTKTKQTHSEPVHDAMLHPIEFALQLEIEGFSMTFHRIGELFLAGELTIPANENGLVFGPRNLEQARQAADKRRWWIPTATQHDSKRTPVEMRAVNEFRQAMQERVDALRHSSVPEILNHMMSEPSLEMRRVYRAVVAHRYEEDLRQARKGANDDK